MQKKFIWWLIVGTKGGKNRARIINELKERPYNIHQLAEELELDYKTVQHHMGVLEESGVVTASGEKYGKLYFLSRKMEEKYDTFREIWIQFQKK